MESNQVVFKVFIFSNNYWIIITFKYLVFFSFLMAIDWIQKGQFSTYSILNGILGDQVMPAISLSEACAAGEKERRGIVLSSVDYFKMIVGCKEAFVIDLRYLIDHPEQFPVDGKAPVSYLENLLWYGEKVFNWEKPSDLNLLRKFMLLYMDNAQLHSQAVRRAFKLQEPIYLGRGTVPCEISSIDKYSMVEMKNGSGSIVVPVMQVRVKA